MKKIISYLVLCILGLFGTYAQEEARSFSFYVPTDKEMSNYIGMMTYLSALEDGRKDIDETSFHVLCNKYIGDESINSFLLEMFLLNTNSTKLKEYLMNYFLNNSIDSDFSKTVIKTYHGDGVNEHINLFKLTEYNIFSKRLSILTFDLDWTSIALKADKRADGQEGAALIYGGGTNAISISFKRYTEANEETLLSLMDSDSNREKYENWQLLEVPKEGIMKRAGTTKYYIGFGIGPDIVPDIVAGTFVIYLYDETEKDICTITYLLNYSTTNVMYDYCYRIYNYLLQCCLYLYLN